ncbi:Ferric reductase like transmembrane component [Blastocladiella emersonii ATCC 22665]|nr:Ferric reductase like transmembrane component [Blastocladiella emersonii ATCC 22665]
MAALSTSSGTTATGSRLPAALTALLLFVAYAFSLFRDVYKQYGKPDRSVQVATNGLVWYTDGLHQGLWAAPLFLASFIVLASGTRGMRPLTSIVSPDRVVFWLQVLLAIGNLWYAAWPLLVVYVVNTPRPNQKWYNITETVVRRLAFPLFWTLGWLFVFALRSPALSPLQAAFGIAYEHSIALHRATGWWSMLWLVIHVVGYFVVFIGENALDEEFRWKSAHGILNNAGALGAIFFFVIGLSSIYLVRRKQFKIFAWFHWLWMPAMAFTILHIGAFAWTIIPPMGLYLIDRVACLWGAGAGPAGAAYSTATAVRVSNDVVALLIPVGPAPDFKPASPSAEESGKKLLAGSDGAVHYSDLDLQLMDIYQPGRYLSLSFPFELAPASHPFSIAAYSPKNRTVSIMIRALGPWTKKLHAMATPEGEPVSLRVAGPMSHSALAHDHLDVETMGQDAYGMAEQGGDVRSHQRTLVAGGVGISKYSRIAASSTRPDDDKFDAFGTDDSSEGGGSSSGSATAVGRAGGNRKVWLCKDPTELAMYASLGADLSGWDVYSRKGFASVVPENQTAVRTTYPLFEQKVASPLHTAARMLLFTTMAGLYIGTYLVSRVVLVLPDPKKTKLCTGRRDTLEKYMRCGLWFNLIPFLSVLVAFTALVQLVTLVQMAATATKREGSVFYCHSIRNAVASLRLIERRFDADNDLDLAHGTRTAGVRRLLSAGGLVSGQQSSMRSCSSKPVRNMLRDRARMHGAVMTDDGIGF